MKKQIFFASATHAPESWWVTARPDGFTRLAWTEYPRMRQSKFATVSMVQLDGTTLAAPGKAKKARETEDQAA